MHGLPGSISQIPNEPSSPLRDTTKMSPPSEDTATSSPPSQDTATNSPPPLSPITCFRLYPYKSSPLVEIPNSFFSPIRMITSNYLQMRIPTALESLKTRIPTSKPFPMQAPTISTSLPTGIHTPSRVSLFTPTTTSSHLGCFHGHIPKQELQRYLSHSHLFPKENRRY